MHIIFPLDLPLQSVGRLSSLASHFLMIMHTARVADTPSPLPPLRFYAMPFAPDRRLNFKASNLPAPTVAAANFAIRH